MADKAAAPSGLVIPWKFIGAAFALLLAFVVGVLVATRSREDVRSASPPMTDRAAPSGQASGQKFRARDGVLHTVPDGIKLE